MKTLEQIAREAAEQIRDESLRQYGVVPTRVQPIDAILAALRSAQPEPNRFPAPEGTGEVPEGVRQAVREAVGIVPTPMLNSDGTRMGGEVDIGPALVVKVMQAIAPFVGDGKPHPDSVRLDWLEKIALDGEDCRSIEINRTQASNKRHTFWSWPLVELKPRGERFMELEWHRYAPPRQGIDDEYGGHWDIHGVKAPTIRAAIDAAASAAKEGREGT